MKGMETAAAIDGGPNKGTALVMAVAAEVALVAIFGLFIGKNYFALLYLNISITLCIALPRLILVGTEKNDHIALRADLRFFFPKMLGYACLAAIMLLEPFSCDSGFKQLGGHFLFDAVLFGNSVLDVLNAQPETSKGSVRRSETEKNQ